MGIHPSLDWFKKSMLSKSEIVHKLFQPFKHAISVSFPVLESFCTSIHSNCWVCTYLQATADTCYALHTVRHLLNADMHRVMCVISFDKVCELLVQVTCWCRGCFRHLQINTMSVSEFHNETFVSYPYSSAPTCSLPTLSRN